MSTIGVVSILLLSLLAIIAVACGDDTSPVQEPLLEPQEAEETASILPAEDEIGLGLNDNDSEVQLHKGQPFVVTLDSNPTTGFSWGVGAIDGKIVRQVGQPIYIEPESQSLGAGGSETLRFVAAETGETDLQLTYRPPWEEGVKPARLFQLRIVVR